MRRNIDRLWTTLSTILRRRNEHVALLRKNLLLGIPFWAASIITGFVAVAYTRLFGIAESVFKFVQEKQPLSIFVVTPVCFCAAYMLVHYFAPNAKGSGIPQVMAAIELNKSRNSHVIDSLLSFRVLLTKIFSSLLMVQGGGAIGREGPTIQVAGAIFRLVERNIPKAWPRLSEQNFMITGAAAGLAAAFNTPLGGIVFAVEELAKIHIRFFRTSLFTAVIIAGLTAQGLLGPYLYLGYPTVGTPGVSIFFAVAVVALLSGWIAGLMCSAILRVREWKKNFSFSTNILLIVVIGLVTASIAYFFNAQILGSGKELMNHLLFSDNKASSFDTALMRVLGPVLCFNTGASGGVFAPALAAGASVGAWFSTIFNYTGTEANILILSGMVGLLTGVTRTPFTSAILVLEMTDRHGVIFHLMFAAIAANVAALMIRRESLYGELKKEYLS